MKKIITILSTVLFLGSLSFSAHAKKAHDPDMDFPQVNDKRFVKDIDKKEFKCRKRIAYKEVLPGISEALTAEPAIETAIGNEKYDIEAGLARVIDKQVHCSGYGLVLCTAIVTICYK